MKPVLMFVVCILRFSANGQAIRLEGRAPAVSFASILRNMENEIKSLQIPSLVARNREVKISSTPLVQYVTKKTDRQPAFYINGKFAGISLNGLDPMSIDSIHVEKREIEIEGQKYYGQIFLKLKNEYCFQPISLTDLVEKYTNVENGLTVFIINNDFIKGDYTQIIVDEKYILKIIVEIIEDENEKQSINVVRLLTKTKENIEKSKEIRIGGLDETEL
jgi:hypothetical protein